MKESMSFSGQVRPEDVRPQPFLYLPFQVPPRTARIDVSYSYSDPKSGDFGLDAGNAVDIGIFDPRGLSFLEAHGFRGWSGTFRREFSISPTEATLGYIRGPILPGQWSIMLGFESILEQGCRYEVKVELTPEDAPEASPEAHPPSAEHQPLAEGERLAEGGPGAMVASSVVTAPAPAWHGQSRGGGWFKGDLHCHTIHSDGLNTVEEIVTNARELGLDFLAITDHNTITHHEELARLAPGTPVVLIPGEEITTYWGHTNAWGLREWIDFRCTDSQAANAVARFVLEKGGLISINHPKAVGPAWMFQDADGYPCMEVWQAPWRWFNWESLERWDGLLQQGRRIVAVGGSDTHSIPPARQMHPHGLGEPTTWVYVPGPLTEEAVLDGIRQGHVFMSEVPAGPQLYLTADADGDGRYETLMGDSIEAREGRVAFRVRCRDAAERRLWVVSDGAILDLLQVDSDDFVHEFSLDVAGRAYVRAELRGWRGRPERGEVVIGMTNPIYVGTGSVNG
ncbi:MAG: CehA/McbA family metallohydrolase [Chloroflexota bacterium]|nr:CehA/McbA family metallohydrolase [Chloroflexota bacterium]